MCARRLSVVMLTIAFFSFYSCEFACGQSLDVRATAERISQGVGRVGGISAEGKLGPIFVFEENHLSRVEQHQIAVMLNRLYLQYGLRQIGLEGLTKQCSIWEERFSKIMTRIGLGGSTKECGVLDASRIHAMGGAAAREDVATRMLGEGEISAAELMTMVYPDVKVFGVERQDEYDVQLDTKNNARIIYLIAIAEKEMTKNQISDVNKLLSENKKDEAFNAIMSSDPWVQEYYKLGEQDSMRPIEEEKKILLDIQNKADEVSADVDADAERKMEALLKFYDTASQRSVTMVERTLAIPKPNPDAPVALIIGAGHTERVLKELKARDAKYAVLTPLNSEYGNLSAEQFERKNRGQWARTSPGTLGAILNSERKPSPIIEKPTSQSYASMYMAAIELSKAVRSGKRVPEDVRAELAALPETDIDLKSVERDGMDVLFKARLRTPGGGEKEVWARVGTVESSEEARNLEQKLLQNIADLEGRAQPDPGGGGSQIPPREPPQGGDRVENEGPGDYRKDGGKDESESKEVGIERLNKNAVVVYGDRATIENVGRLSRG